MSTLVLEEQPQKVADKFDTLYRAVTLMQGVFTVILIQTSLDNQTEVIQKIKQDSKAIDKNLKLNLVELQLDTLIGISRSFHPLDLLNKAKQLTNKEMDLMLITGLEKLIGENPILNNVSSNQLAHALEPIDLGRSFFQRYFNFPVVFCLPYTDMRIFLNQAVALSRGATFFYDFRDFEW